MKRIKGPAVLLAASALLMITCKAPDLFSEYDGQSFLSTTSLQSDNWQLMPDYSFETGTTALDYMDYALVSSSGGKNGGPVYRLEIKNLLSNGDFETGAVTPWTTFNMTTGSASIISSGLTINNDTVAYILGPNEQLNINVSSGFTNNKTYVSYKNYKFKYDYRTASTVVLNYIPAWDSLSTDPYLGDYTKYEAYGGPGGSSSMTSDSYINTYPPLDPDVTDPKITNIFEASGTAVNDTLTFAGVAQVASIDNFRIVRTPEGDFDLKLRLKMNIDHRSDLEIIPGYYRFSVWVKQEDVSALTNVYQADRIELGIQAYDTENNKNVSDYKVFYQTQSLSDLYSLETEGGFSGNWSSGWIQLVLASDFTFQVPDISADPVMELTISPSNTGIKDNSWNRLSPGSILISEPTLEYSSIPW